MFGSEISNLILTILFIVFSFGVSKYRNKLCSISVLGLYGVSFISFQIQPGSAVIGEAIHLLLEIGFGIFLLPFIQGLRATLSYPKLSKLDKVDLDPFDPVDCFNLSMIRREDGNLTEALTYCDFALEKDPTLVFVLNNRGEIYFRMVQYQKALMTFENVIKIDPANEIGLCRKGTVLSLLGKDEETIKYFDNLLSIHPNLADVWYERGKLKVKAGEHESGFGDLRKAIEIGKVEFTKRIQSDESFNHLRDNQQFDELLKQ